MASATSTPAPLAALRPRRITLVGDSVMGEVAAAVAAATAGRADVDYVLTIGTANVNDDWWDVWPRAVARDRPDDVAVLVGPWEINRSDLGTPSWARWYGDRLDRWADQLTARGAHLVWLTPAPARAADIDEKLAVVDVQYAALAARRHVALVDTAGALGGTSYVERAADGGRLRRVDGLHLCPAGAARIADALLQSLDVPTNPGWRDGPWTRAEPAYSAAECPP
jgi:hypothetical protein